MTFTEIASSSLLGVTEVARELTFNNELWLKMVSFNGDMQYVHCKEILVDTIYGRAYRGVLLDENNFATYLLHTCFQSPVKDSRCQSGNISKPLALKHVIVKSFHRASVENRKHYWNKLDVGEDPFVEMETIIKLNEAKFMHVPKLHAVWLSANWFYSIAEDCGVDLYEFMKLSPAKDVVKNIFKNIVSMVVQLKTKFCLAHCDLSLENVCIDGEGNVKLIDFGLSRVVHAETMNDSHSRAGKLVYMSPEKYFATPFHRYSTMKNEVWSLGILLFIFCTKQVPYRDSSNIDFCDVKQSLEKLDDPGHWFCRAMRDSVGHKGIDLLKSMMTFSPQDRICINSILEHPLFE